MSRRMEATLGISSTVEAITAHHRESPFQLETSRKKLETVVSQESELISLKVELSEAHLERDLASERLHRLAEEISQLHVDKKNLVEEISRLQMESSHRETDDDEQVSTGPSSSPIPVPLFFLV